jgi:predicted DNA-binding protein
MIPSASLRLCGRKKLFWTTILGKDIVIRTQIYLTQQEKDALRVLSAESGKKQSEIIREAIDSFIAKSSKTQRQDVLDLAAGMWKDREDLPDFSGLRSGWDRKSLS